MRIIGSFVTVILAATLATGCVPPGGTYGTSSYQVATTTNVWVNGHELSDTDKAKLEWLLDAPVPAGNYYVTDDGKLGVVGQQATIDLIAYAKAKGVYQQQGGAAHSSHYNGYSGDSITSDGNGCTIMSSGSMTFSSGC